MVLILILMMFVWAGYLVYSYFYVNQAILLMLLPVYPNAGKLLKLIEFSSTHRELMTIIWIVMMIMLIIGQFILFFSKKELKVNKKIVLIMTIIFGTAALAYPVFSNDIFNYMFGAKTVVYYHQNPFWVMPKTFFRDDLWLRFMNNIDNVYYHIGGRPVTYFYGPIFLGYTLIPYLFFGAVEFQKLFWSYKLMGVVLFLMTGYLFKKINPKDKLVWAYWFFNPFLILELLTNSHNDLVMIFLFVLSVYWWQKNKILSIVSFLLSILTKWVSGFLGIVFLFKEKYRYLVFKILGIIILIFHALDQRQSWYYSWIYMVFPFAKLKKSSWFWILVFQSILLLNYFNFIWLNRWVDTDFIKIIKYLLPVIVVLNEYGIFNKIIKRRNKTVVSARV